MGDSAPAARAANPHMLITTIIKVYQVFSERQRPDLDGSW